MPPDSGPVAPVVARGFCGQPLLAGRAGRFVPPVAEVDLPGALLGRLTGSDGRDRVCQLLGLVAPVTTDSWSGCLPGGIDTQITQRKLTKSPLISRELRRSGYCRCVGFLLMQDRTKCRVLRRAA